jgi:hypothetical protein
MYVPPAPFVFSVERWRPYVEQGRSLHEGVALVGHKLAKIKLRVQRRMRLKKPIWASI